MEGQLDALEHSRFVIGALPLIDSTFQKIVLLRESVVKVWEGGVSEYIPREMKGSGWTADERRGDSDVLFSDGESMGGARSVDRKLGVMAGAILMVVGLAI